MLVVHFSLKTYIPKETQVFLCAMDNSHLDIFKEQAKVIKLDENKLLSNLEYERVKKIFVSFK